MKKLKYIAVSLMAAVLLASCGGNEVQNETIAAASTEAQAVMLFMSDEKQDLPFGETAAALMEATKSEDKITEPVDNAPAPEISSEASSDKPQGSNTLLYVIIYAVAVIAVAAVAIIVLAKQKR